MKWLLAVASLALALTAHAEPYVTIGGAAGSEGGGFALGAGARAKYYGAELVYLDEKHNRDSVVTTGSVDGSRQWRGFGLAGLGYLPVATSVDLVGRIARERLNSGDDTAYRTSIGAGAQYGTPDRISIRVLVERGNDETRGTVNLLLGW